MKKTTSIGKAMSKLFAFLRRHSICTRAIAMTLSIVLLFYVIPSAVFAEAADLLSSDGSDASSGVTDVEALDSAVTGNTDAPRGELYEAEPLREEYVKHFHLEDGSYVAAQYPLPVHYMDGNGNWQDIDNTLTEESGGEFSTSNARVKFSKKINGSGKVFTLKDGEYSVTMSIIGGNKGTAGTVTNGADSEYDTELQKMMNLEKLSAVVTYADVFSETDIEYVVDSWNIKENIIVKEKQESYTYSFELKLGGLVPTLLETGEIILSAEDTNEVVYTLPAPFAIDSAKQIAPVDSVYYTLTGSGKKYTLTITADSEWMNSEERAYPITIDPTVSKAAGNAEATSIGSAYPASSGYLINYPYLITTTSGTAAYYRMTELPTIPDAAYFTNASLYLPYAGSAGRFMPTMILHEVTSPWSQTSLTYNGYMLGQGAYNTSIVSSSTGLYQWDITELANKWYNSPETNYGVRIEQAGIEAETFGLDITVWLRYSCSTGPVLTASYINMDGLEDHLSYSSHSAGVAGNGSVNLATGDLTFAIPTVSTVDSLMPTTATMVYNSSEANMSHIHPNTYTAIRAPFLPYGFKLNLCETVVSTQYSTSTTKPCYIYEDADGTKHDYFFSSGNSFINKEGLQMTMLVSGEVIKIFDLSNITRIFTKTSYVNASGSKPVTGAWVLTQIQDVYGNQLLFNYDTSYTKLVSVSLKPNGSSEITTLYFLYTDDGMLYAIYNPSSLDYVMFRYSTEYNGDINTDDLRYLRVSEFGHMTSVGAVVNEFNSYYTNNAFQPTQIVREYECYYYYNSDGTISEVRDGLGDTALSYTWSSNKVTKITEKGRDDNDAFVTGQELSIRYGTGYTDVKSTGNDEIIGTADDITTRYVFDNRGRAVNVYSFSEGYSEVYGATVGTYHTYYSIKNKLKEQIVIDGSSVNYILNGDFEAGSSFTAVDFWTFSGRAKRAKYTLSGNYGAYALNLTPRASETASATQYVHLNAGDYTLNFQSWPTDADGVTGKVVITSISSSGLSVTEEIPVSKNVSTSAKIDFSKTFTVPNHINGGDNLRIKIEFTAGSGITKTPDVLVDNVTLTKNIDTAQHSIVSYGSFESSGITSSGSSSAVISDFWTTESSATPTVVSSGDSIFGQAVKVPALGVTSESYVKQRIYEIDYNDLWNYDYDPNMYTENTGFDFIISGYAKASDMVYSGVFRLRADVIYYQGEGEEDVVITYYFPFVKTTDGWQFTCGVVSGNYEASSGDANSYDCVRAVDIYCEYSNQANGYALFDNISAVDDNDASVERYSYNSEGLLSHVHNTYYNETYHYDDNRNLITVANNYGELTEYVYTANNLVDYSIEYKFTNTCNFDDELEYPYYYISPEDHIIKTPLIKTVYTYNTLGLCTKVESFEVEEDSNGNIVRIEDSKSVVQNYTYNTTAGSAIFGALLSETNINGITTSYIYDESNGRIIGEINPDAKTGTAYEYDEVSGQLKYVTPMTYNEETNSYHAMQNGSLAEYTYNGKNLLSRIETESTKYTFTYDSYNNPSSVSIGEAVLATYTYNQNNGKLFKTTYGNGLIEEYVYDRLENISEIWYTRNGTRTLAYSYEYTTDGKLHKYIDYKSGRTTVYVYDSSDRLINTVEYENGELVEDYVTTFLYDDKNRLGSIHYRLNYTAGSSVSGSNLYYIYIYGDDGNVEIFTANTEFTQTDITNCYDDFGRVTSRVFEHSIIGTDYLLNIVDYSYTSDDYSTSAKVKTYESSILVSSTVDEKYVYNYEYDSKGNISKVTICHLKVTYDTEGNVISSTKLDDDIIISYTYDHLNQLVCEHNETDKIISYYTYDSAGNIIGNQEYYYEETPDDLYLNEIKRYTYSTSDWGDLLTSFNGRSITYDAIGNPLSYYNVMHYAFTWEGRQLIRAEIEDDVYTFTYNDEGIRTSKTVNGVTTHYYLDGSQIVAEETEGNITVYLYDLNGSPLGFQYHKATDAADTWEIYWYEKNLHGDIISIYSDVDDNGNVNRLVNYTYDAWGNFYEEKLYTGVNEAIASNPYTYRGYYYDRDLWFYYLNSRYYDSYTGRFINADSALYHNSSFGYNLFAYCGNNPVNYVDYDGEVAEIVAAGVSIAPYVIAAAALTAVVALMLIYIPKAVDIIMEAADSESETKDNSNSQSSSPKNEKKTDISKNNKKAKDYTKAKSNSQADKWAKKVGYRGAEDLKKDFVGNQGSKFNIFRNRSTGELILIGIKKAIEISTDLFI